MEIQAQIGWLNKADFDNQNPIVGRIVDITTGINQWEKEEYQLIVDFQGIGERKFSLYGLLLNQCIKKYGTKSEHWLGKPLALLQEITPKGIRRVLG